MLAFVVLEILKDFEVREILIPLHCRSNDKAIMHKYYPCMGLFTVGIALWETGQFIFGGRKINKHFYVLFLPVPVVSNIQFTFHLVLSLLFLFTRCQTIFAVLLVVITNQDNQKTHQGKCERSKISLFFQKT